MSGHDWVEFEAIVATTHPVEKYGGVRLGDEVLVNIAEALNSGALPMIGQHDWTRPLRTRDVRASVVTMPDGERAVQMAGLVVRDDWEAHGPFGGMSFSASVPLARAEGPHPNRQPLWLSADGQFWDDTSIAEACMLMSSLGPVSGGTLVQFAALNDARVVLEIGYELVITLGPGLATSAIWDGIVFLLRRRRRLQGELASHTRVELVTPSLSGPVIGIIDTTSEDVAQAAIAAYSAAVEQALHVDAEGSRTVLVWHADEGGWAPPN